MTRQLTEKFLQLLTRFLPASMNARVGGNAQRARSVLSKMVEDRAVLWHT
jgi:hypothetical protein